MVRSFAAGPSTKPAISPKSSSRFPESVQFQLKLCLTEDYPLLPDRWSADSATFKATMISGRLCSELQKSKAIYSSY